MSHLLWQREGGGADDGGRTEVQAQFLPHLHYHLLGVPRGQILVDELDDSGEIADVSRLQRVDGCIQHLKGRVRRE